LTQSVPKVSVAMIVKTVKSITGKEILRLHPEVKSKL
jgi:putative transposase